MWEDPWIPTTPARPARSLAPVMHLNMRVSDIINQESKEWDAGLLDDYENQVLSLGNICLLDGSWTASERFSGCGWVWMDSRENIQLMGTRNFTRCESALHSEVEALRWAMENMLQHSPCQSFGTDCKELITMLNDPQEWPSFATELEKIETLKICFPDFKINHVPRVRNQLSDFLAKTARNFRRELLFIGCFIPVWLPRPPQA
ncbi:hypothetical protein IGI04_031266 [Brassica rapa subsp. trilocularis]|uniref:RNase H type-1 domain-containing protein n=1 Tax=Brassica rapa subsp. trilocularis TaxID=1813537 RepID=A0ABQ7LVT3_BRACM|nr:hypothetical protein IGI04_031266 [Brassica rapa subsp. trilocularis]